MRPFRYVRPTRIGEIVNLLQEHGPSARLLAGGTDLVVGLRHGKIAAEVVVDLKHVAELPPSIVVGESMVTVSATSLLADLVRFDAIKRHFPALVEAASVVGSVQIRNRATLAGNICNASPAADTVPVLVLYEASVTLFGPAGERQVPVVDFIQGNRQIALQPGEFVTAVNLPIPRRALGTSFDRITRRRGVDLATINLCCSVDSAGTSTFVFGAAAPRPLLVRDETGALGDVSASAADKSAALDCLMKHAKPISDVRGSAEYRLAMFRVLAERVHQRATLKLADRMITWPA